MVESNTTANLVLNISMLDKEINIKLMKYNEMVRVLKTRFPILENSEEFKEKKLIYKENNNEYGK